MNWDLLPNTYGPSTSFDILRLLLGKELGRGSARTVYQHPQRPDLVIKIEDAAQSFQNVHEWEAWRQVRDTKWARWFAPCVEISPSGVVLIQKFAKPLSDDMMARTFQLPNLLCDFKPENYGVIDGQVVARDYGIGNFFANGIGYARLRNIKPSMWTNSPSGA